MATNFKFPSSVEQPRFIASSTTGSGGSVTSITGTVPTGTRPGDLMVAFHVEADGRTINTPAGWTVAGSFAPGGNASGTVFYKTAQAGETSTVFSLSSAARQGVVIMTFRNLSFNIIQTFQTELTIGVCATATSITPASGVGRDYLLLNLTGGRKTTGTLTTTAPSGFTSLVNFTASNDPGPFFNISSRRVSGGATGSSQVGSSGVTPDDNGAVHLVLSARYDQLDPASTPVDFDDAFIRKDIFTQGGLWTWGLNLSGQLGDNTTTSRSSPIQTVASGTNWKQLSTGSLIMGGVKTDGTLWLWGTSTSGQLGDNTTTPKSSPVQTIAGGSNWVTMALGGTGAGGIKTDGTLWMWGGGAQTGDNTNVAKSSPVQTIAGGSNWVRLAISAQGTVGAIKSDGTLWMWGAGSANGSQIGDNSSVSRSSPVQTVAGGTNWKQIAGGNQNFFGIKTDGTLWGWGANTNGELGDNTTTIRSSPVQTVAGGTNWKQVGGGSTHTAAIKIDGTLWTWGLNDTGQLGDNTTTSKSSPVQTVSSGRNWREVRGALGYTAAIKTDGSLWTWGTAASGRLGDNNVTTNKSSPVQTVAGGTNWKTIGVTGTAFMGAVREDFY